jgi:hypothetical protein
MKKPTEQELFDFIQKASDAADKNDKSDADLFAFITKRN